ncbi:MAG: glucosamine 6-phosphate synthetase [Ruminococcus sp.]|nr:glucosamine 6-phosphate synthetase [Ruminococcus sp.]MCM1382614.1 hypothetical protein [Muribaculaceae bacterium]
MGHTRMTTQGSEKFNYNNHPFFGRVNGANFALAHNGMLQNDTLLRETENLPKTHIGTDSYVAVQLIEKANILNFESLKNMAEKTEGSFCYTVLSDRNELYIVKGSNPIALYKFDGFYLYASTEEILRETLQKLNLPTFGKVTVKSGDILKLDAKGGIEVGEFDFREDYYGYCGQYFPMYDKEYLQELALVYGMDSKDILTLMEYGYDIFDIEEMLYNSGDVQEYIDDIKSFQMI